MNEFKELEGLTVKIEDVLYMPSLSAPPEKPHPFAYFISIKNNSSEPVRLSARKWVVREDGDPEIVVVEGEGIVGQKPYLQPGEEFSYNSYHVVARNATAQGAYFGETEMGDKVITRVPDFTLEIPDWAMQ